MNVVNVAGNDIGIVTARFSTTDSITISFSLHGINLGASSILSALAGIATDRS